MPYRLVAGPLLKLSTAEGGGGAAGAGGVSQEERRRFLVLYEIVASEGSDRPPPPNRGTYRTVDTAVDRQIHAFCFPSNFVFLFV